MQRYTLAEVCIAGIVLDALGGLYLAYDLLGGKRGPLRTLARVATYSTLFGIGYGIPFGPVFGVIAGIGLGFSLGVEFTIISKELVNPIRRAIFFAFLRGTTLALAGSFTFGYGFGMMFGGLVFLGLLLIYTVGFSPTKLYSQIGKPKMNSLNLMAGLSRGVVIGTSGFLSGLVFPTNEQAWRFGIEVGFVVSLVSTSIGFASPFIEWWADNLPEKHLGAMGAVLVVCGFLFQMVQYLVVILKIPVT